MNQRTTMLGAMQRMIGVSCWIAAMIFHLANPALAAADQLRITLQPGQAYQLKYTQVTQQTTEYDGKSIEMNSTMGMEMTWRVTDVDDAGMTTMKQRFTRFQIEMQSAQTDPIKYDSADEIDPTGYAYEMDKTLEPLLDADIEVTMSPRGEIIAVAIPQATMDAIREAPGSMRIRQLLTTEGIRDTLAGSLTIYPEEEVQEGDTWQSDRESKITNGMLKQNHTYTLGPTEERDGKSVRRIDVKTTLAFEQPEDPIHEPQRIVDQSMQGVIWVDPTSGMFMGSEFKSTLVTEAPYRESKLKTTAKGQFQLEVKAVASEGDAAN